RHAAGSLLGTINDLLDFAKIEAGKLALDPAPFGLRAAVGETLRALAVRAHEKGLELVCRIRPEVPDELVGDAGRLRQVLTNLVGNAVKFTERGEIVVEVSVTGSAPDAVVLRFAVRDTGIGVSPDKQETIFRAFEQEDTSTTRRYGGTGLGLTIAGRMIALMDRPIGLESQPGVGSTFSFTARFGRVEGVAAAPERDLDGVAVLVVGGGSTSAALVDALREWRMEPTLVGDGEAALARLRDGLYGVVLLDSR